MDKVKDAIIKDFEKSIDAWRGLATTDNMFLIGCIDAYEKAIATVNQKFNKEGTGYWIMGVDEAGYEYGTCSACGYVEQDAFPRGDIPNYCSHCGLKMIKKRGR